MHADLVIAATTTSIVVANFSLHTTYIIRAVAQTNKVTAFDMEWLLPPIRRPHSLWKAVFTTNKVPVFYMEGCHYNQ